MPKAGEIKKEAKKKPQKSAKEKKLRRRRKSRTGTRVSVPPGPGPRARTHSGRLISFQKLRTCAMYTPNISSALVS
jgi:hypothetical protein